MCGRYTLTTEGQKVAEAFELLDVPMVATGYNIAPTQQVAVVRAQADDSRALSHISWGLVPFRDWQTRGRPLINARSETVAEKPLFKWSFRRRRCLVVADGWYEWKKVSDGRQPYRFVRPDRGLFGMAGIWAEWTTDDGEVVESCAVLTTDANAVAAAVHHRMPVIIPPANYGTWLRSSLRDPAALQPLLVPGSADDLTVYPVSRMVNNARNQGSACIESVTL